jgi:two-component system sensor histidine kinase/response regulator
VSVTLDRPSALGLVDPSAGDVLIVDDFVDTLALFEALLSEDGHRVRIASSGMRALELVEEREPELVLLDVSMPQMDGGEVLQRLRARRGGGPAVIMLTAAKREPHAIEQGLRGGADAYLTKPIDSRELLARVRAALESFRLRRQLEAQRRDHVAMLVHDLRHPLSSLGLIAELLDADDVPVEERRASVQTIRALCGDMALLVDGVLAASRLEAGVFHVEPRLVSVGELVDRTLSAFKPLAERKRIRFTFEGSREQQVDADVVKLRQAIDNLVANAFKFTPRDGKIRLRVSRASAAGLTAPPGATPAEGIEAVGSPSGSHPIAAAATGVAPRPVVIEISDSGPGIAEAERATIFDRYRQGSGGRAAGGAGLGLAIARGIAEAHGGSLRVTSGELGGATFRMEIPSRS